MARKAIEWSDEQQKQFQDLCSIFCTRQEICAIMQVSEKTLNKLINKYFHDIVAPDTPKSQKITFTDAFEYFSAPGKESLRRAQFKAAEAGDRQMLMWLGKQYLNQTDRKEVKKTVNKTGKEATALDNALTRYTEHRVSASN